MQQSAGDRYLARLVCTTSSTWVHKDSVTNFRNISSVAFFGPFCEFSNSLRWNIKVLWRFIENSPIFDWPKITTSTPYKKFGFYCTDIFFGIRCSFGCSTRWYSQTRPSITFKMAFNFCEIEPPVWNFTIVSNSTKNTMYSELSPEQHRKLGQLDHPCLANLIHAKKVRDLLLPIDSLG